MEPKPTRSAIFCSHANERPYTCPCDEDCYCREHSCKSGTNHPKEYVVPRIFETIDRSVPEWEPNEMYEHAISSMRQWLEDIYPPSQVDRAMLIEHKYVPKSFVKQLNIHVKLWTATNMYTVSCSLHPDNPQGYMGAFARSRKSRTGETWTRGNDLPDGKYTEETWQNILHAIVRYEVEEIKSEKWKWKE